MHKQLKAPIILALISALVAAPLFADTVTMKSGEIYVGEIIERTDEYIKLKMGPELLTIPVQDIARITTPEEEAEWTELALIATAKMNAEKAAEAEVDKTRWLAAGCLLNCIGLTLALATEPTCPGTHLVGKPSGYVTAFAEAYRKKAKNIRTEQATIGFLASSIACGITGFIIARSLAESCGEGFGEGFAKGCAEGAEEEENGCSSD